MTGASLRIRPALTRWWAQRSARERMLLGVLASALALYVAVVGAAQPLRAARADALAAIARHETVLARLAALPAGPASPDPTARPATAVLTETAPVFGLTIRRIEAEGGGARLELENAGFAEIVLWIEELERQHALRLVAVDMDRQPEPGVVSARLTFER